MFFSKPSSSPPVCSTPPLPPPQVVSLYESAKVTHLLCKHQKSPVFMQAVRENKRCITVFWLNDVLLRGKMAPPWQAIHLPTPFA